MELELTTGPGIAALGQSWTIVCPPGLTPPPTPLSRSVSAPIKKSRSMRIFEAFRHRVTLQASIDNSILRGVSIRAVVRNFGAILSAQEFGLQHGYAMSEPTESLHDFISHDWGSGRWQKLLSLCMIYNGYAAYISSCLVAILFSVLQWNSVGVLPKLVSSLSVLVDGEHYEYNPGGWCILVCPTVYFSFFFFWQEFRSGLGFTSRLVFLDKCCVNQVNEEKKKKAIRGLAGFLKHSQRLVIIWSPRYFTRLWCTYELASWLHLKKRLSTIYFMPLALSNMTVCMIVLLWVDCICVCWLPQWMRVDILFPSLRFQRSDTSSQPHIIMFFSFQFTWGILAAHFCRRQIHDLGSLRQQLTDFSITNAACYCCSNGHIMPETNQLIPCDRQLVYNTIAEWFPAQTTDLDGSSPDTFALQHGGLHRFDKMVHQYVAPAILDYTGPTRVPYRVFLLMTCPCFWYFCDTVIVGCELWPQQVQALIICGELVALFASIPVTLMLALCASAYMDEMLGLPANMMYDWLITVLSGIVIGFILVMSYGVFRYLPFFWCCLLYSGAAVYVFALPRWKSRQRFRLQGSGSRSFN